MISKKIKMSIAGVSLILLASVFGLRTESYASDAQIECSSLDAYCCYNIYNIRITGEGGKTEWECTSGGNYPCITCCD